MKFTIHQSARTHRNLFYKSPITSVWDEYLDKLFKLSHLVDIQGFVLMSNHYHLLLKADLIDLKKFQKEFQFSFFNQANVEQINSNRYLKYSYKYIYQNPVRANLVEKVEDYPFSSIHYLAKGHLFDFPIHDRFGFTDEYKLCWLNSKL